MLFDECSKAIFRSEHHKVQRALKTVSIWPGIFQLDETRTIFPVFTFRWERYQAGDFSLLNCRAKFFSGFLVTAHRIMSIWTFRSKFRGRSCFSGGYSGLPHFDQVKIVPNSPRFPCFQLFGVSFQRQNVTFISLPLITEIYFTTTDNREIYILLSFPSKLQITSTMEPFVMSSFHYWAVTNSKFASQAKILIHFVKFPVFSLTGRIASKFSIPWQPCHFLILDLY